MVVIEGEIPVGELVPVRITGAMAYDLTGVVEREPARVVAGILRDNSVGGKHPPDNSAEAV
jgi:hypothetical protein